jgi:hypothetical protein
MFILKISYTIIYIQPQKGSFMPSSAAHHYFGQQVWARLPQDLSALIARHKALFDLGLQGPDLLFYHHPAKENPVSALGVRIHYLPAAKRIIPAAAALAAQRDDAAFCYLLGFTCHFVLDSSFHGDIAVLAPKLASHFLLEAELDRQVILLHNNKPANFKRQNLVKIPLSSCASLRLIYPELSVKTLKSCAQEIVFFNRILYSPSGRKLRLIRTLEKALGKEGMFSSMAVTDAPNAFEADAKALFLRIAGIIDTGAKAVINVVEHTRSGAPLLGLFQSNFE